MSEFQKASELANQVLNEVKPPEKNIRTAREQSFRTRRDYTNGKRPQKPLTARFKMQIYFRDGNKRYFYSMDFHKPYHDEWRGLDDLMYQAQEWYDEGKIKTVVIYANLDAIPKTSDQKYDTTIWKLYHTKQGQRREFMHPDYSFKEIDHRIKLQIRNPYED